VKIIRYWEISNFDDSQSKFEMFFYQIAIDLKEKNQLSENQKGSIITKKSLENRLGLQNKVNNESNCCY
jgi:hypothetical protein